MKYNDFRLLIFNEIISILGYDEYFENLYNRFEYGFTDSMIKSNVKEIIEAILENMKVNGEFDNFKGREKMKTPYSKQVGGEHYISEIQPVQFIKANNLNFNQGNVVKYISRYRKKNGLKDLEKVIQYTLFEAFEEYPEEYLKFTKAIKELLG